MKHVFRKVLILLLVFVAVGMGVLVFTLFRDKETVSYAGMESATLPVINLYYGEQELNELHGYTAEMELPLMRETMTPLDGQRRMGVRIETYGTLVTGIAYEVRSLDGQELIDQQHLNQWEEDGGQIRLELQLSSLLEKETEYCLIFRLSTEDREKISYFTRVIYGEEMKTDQLLDFAWQFSRATFEPETAKTFLPQYLQPNGTMPDNDYSTVTIHSRYSMITWGNLNPERQAQTEVRITELTPTQLSVTFLYEVLIGEENGVQHSCRVEEYFCVRWRNGQLYLLDYQRRMNQKFVPDRLEISENRLMLGILSDGRDQIQMKTSPDGKLCALAADGVLYGYDTEKKSIWPVFSFLNGQKEDARTNYDAHKIQLVDCRDGGQINFIVYGYMNRGVHEGEVGISFFRYDSTNAYSDELFYIPVNVSPQMLQAEMGSLAYMSNENSFYLLYGGGIYSIDISSGETVRIAENVRQDACWISGDSSLIAWQEETEEKVSDKLYCLNMLNDVMTELSAESGEYLVLEGFVDTDLVYGIGRRDDIQYSAGVEVGYPLYRLMVLNRDMEVQTEYEQKGIYISEVQVEENRIVLSRLKAGADGALESWEGDILMRNSAVDEQVNSQMKTTRDDLLGTICYIELREKPIDGVEYHWQSAQYRDQSLCQLVALNKNESSRPQYYVYTRGELTAVTDYLSSAINQAYDVMGVVLDGSQNTIWNRDSRALYKTLKLPQKDAVSEEESLAVCLELILEYGGFDSSAVSGLLASGRSPQEILDTMDGVRTVDLYGGELGYILFYINRGNPVLAVTGDSSALLIIGYETNSLTYYDPVKAVNVRLPMQEAEKLFSGYGNGFLTYLRSGR